MICFEATWLKEWNLKDWSVYESTVRTNNHVEGWHNKLNKKLRPQTSFYLLIRALHVEALDIATDEELIELNLLKKTENKDIRYHQKRLFKY